ncbi:hypothetical protein [Priestia megaterium]
MVQNSGIKKALAAGEAAGLFDYHRVMELIQFTHTTTERNFNC